ncbi:DMT family transporter [Patescibacteria group bacterium]|nr:DMT family transporter [Patescibacteria group bacterium]MBU1663587.1 DMT family transporter [Patescibacteria group bacterium]MBU1934136.1 DMT family transporter [Patescibacteria group bacterium]MBU2234000.1 DMT family transporter [Patescibacteria group bacterium]
MLNWFFIALAAPFLWALVNLVDKYLVTNYSGKETSSSSLVLFSSLVGIAASFIIGVFTPEVFAISLLDKALLIFIGIFSICGIIFYLFALEIEDVSTVIPWMLTIPAFGYVLGYFFLGETLTRTQLLGTGIIFFGAIILSVDFSQIQILFKKRLALHILLFCLIYSINGVIFKFVASANSFWVASFWEYLGLGISGIFIFLFFGSYRRDFIFNIKTSGKFIFSINIISEIMTIIGNLLTNFALLIAPVALVYMVGSFQPVAVLLFSFLSTKFLPKIVSEDFSHKVIIPKMIAIIFMLVGSVILFL